MATAVAAGAFGVGRGVGLDDDALGCGGGGGLPRADDGDSIGALFYFKRAMLKLLKRGKIKG